MNTALCSKQNEMTHARHYLTHWKEWAHARSVLASDLSHTSLQQLDIAWNFAATAHASQRRPNGEPYISHCIETVELLYVGEGIRDMTTLTIALLHDTVEDTPVTLADIRTRFNPLVADGVYWLTIPPAQEAARKAVREARFAHLHHAPTHIRAIKLGDRYSSVQRLRTGTLPEKQARRFHETVQHILPLATSFPFFARNFALWRAEHAYLSDYPSAPNPTEEELIVRWGRSLAPGAFQIGALLRLLRASGLRDTDMCSRWQIAEWDRRRLNVLPLPKGDGWRDELRRIVMACNAKAPDVCIADLGWAYQGYMQNRHGGLT